MSRFYVDDTCVCNSLCTKIAPDNFIFDEETLTSKVVKQPSNPEELKNCREAVKTCPAGAIHEEVPRSAD